MSFVLIAAAIIILQIGLCKLDDRRYGLILPAISLLISLIVTLFLRAVPYDAFAAVVIQLAYSLLLMNIPTVVLLAIYFVFRDNRKKRKQIDQMVIQDLE